MKIEREVRINDEDRNRGYGLMNVINKQMYFEYFVFFLNLRSVVRKKKRRCG